jgi:hypothetical protein
MAKRNQTSKVAILTKKLQEWSQLITILGTILTGGWFGVVRPAIERVKERLQENIEETVRELVREEISLAFHLAFQGLSKEQVADAMDNWEREKMERRLKELEARYAKDSESP